MLIHRDWPENVHKMPTDPKPKLKAQIIPVFRVKYKNLEQYVRQVFGFDFDLLSVTGCVNGVCLEYQVNGTSPQVTSQQAVNLRRGRLTRNLPLILEVLVKDGYIPAGRYIIDTHAKS